MGASLPGGGAPFCRRAAEVDGLSAVDGRVFLPRVFGRRSFLAPALFATRRARLGAELAHNAGTLSLDRAIDWPPRGRVQINDEVLEYRALAPGGDGLAALLRSVPRHHARRSRVVLLPPAGTLDWCIADHGATLIEARADGPGGEVLSGISAESVDLGGRAATLVRRDRLPLAVVHAAFAIETRSTLSAAPWSELPGSSAFNPMHAFDRQAPSQGAVLTAERPVLAARFHRAVAVTPDRLDRLVGAALSFEFKESSGWGAQTRLMLRAGKGPRTLDLEIRRNGTVVPVEVASPAAPKGAATATLVQRVRIALERLEHTGARTNAAGALSGSFDDTAGHSGTAAAALVGSIASTRPEASHRIDQAIVCARVANAGGGPVEGILRLRVGSLLDRAASFTLDAGTAAEWRHAVALPVDVDGRALLGASARFSVEFPAGGDVRVEHLWLEIDRKLPLPIGNSAAIGGLVSKGTVIIPGAWHRVRVDVATLAEGGLTWEFFDSTVEELSVRFELQNPPAIPLWDVALRDVHWSHRVHPATSVEPVERLYTTVDGLHTRSDGTANPVGVIETLVAPEPFDSDSAAAMEAVADARGVAFAAVFMEGTATDVVLGRAVGESTLSLAWERGQWRLLESPLSHGSAAPLEVATSALPAVPWHARLRPSMPRAAGPLVLHSADGAVLHSAASRHGGAMELRWVVRGGAALARWIEARRDPLASELEVPLGAAWMALPVGARMAVSAGGGHLAGEIARLSARGADVRATLSATERLVLHFRAGDGVVLRAERRRALVFLVAGRAVAVLTDDGDLLLAGGAVELVPAATIVQAVFSWHSSTSEVRASHTVLPDDTAWIAFAAGGTARATVPVVESAAIADAAPVQGGARVVGATLVGGPPGGTAAMRITLNHIAIRGAIRTGQPL